MDAQYDRAEYSREPTIEDLVELCRHLNEAGVKYAVIGGFAVILNGYLRTTGDIDLLVDSTIDNVSSIKKALLYLPDQAIREIKPQEVAQYSVVRVADEIVIDLIEKACGITYEQAASYLQYRETSGVLIPYLKPELLIKTKMTIRPKDHEDRLFLEKLLDSQQAESAQPSRSQNEFLDYMRRLMQSLRNWTVRKKQ